MKNNSGFSTIFHQFWMPGGACRPGYARETERADLNRVTRTVSSMITVKLADIVPKIRNFIQIVPKLSPNGLQIVPKWSPNGLKTASKLVLEAFQGPNLILGSILGGIVPQFGLPRDLKKYLESMIV